MKQGHQTRYLMAVVGVPFCFEPYECLVSRNLHCGGRGRTYLLPGGGIKLLGEKNDGRS